jgi:NAD-dependent deacetylase
MKKKIVVFTGAGISAESGIPTFRDTDGLWNKHIADEVASITGWKKNKEKVLDFHNEFAKEFEKCEPNDAHKSLAKLEEQYDVVVVTQNIDNLHEKGGFTNVLHIHGNISESKSTVNDPFTPKAMNGLETRLRP